MKTRAMVPFDNYLKLEDKLIQLEREIKRKNRSINDLQDYTTYQKLTNSDLVAIEEVEKILHTSFLEKDMIPVYCYSEIVDGLLNHIDELNKRIRFMNEEGYDGYEVF